MAFLLRSITPPATLAVSLADIKSHLVIENTDSDTRLTALINSATDFCERETGRAFPVQTWEIVLRAFPNKIYLPKPPAVSVSSVKYFDTNNTEQTWAAENYRVVIADKGIIEPVNSYPATFARTDSITVRFVCGYTTQPANLTHAIKLLVGAWNENREGEVVGTIASVVSLGVDRLLAPLTVWGYR